MSHRSRNSQPSLPRRSVIAGGLTLAAGAGLLGPALAAELVATPHQTAGPFYPQIKPLDSNSDLVRVEGRSEPAAGEVIHVFGQVMDQSGRSLPGLLVELWQCDAFGRYHHPREPGGGADPNFQGYGRMLAGNDGSFRFRTIEPVPYTGRTPHIHFAVTDPSGGRLTTQMYLRGHPLNERDFIFRRIGDPKAREIVQVTLEAAPEIEAGTRAGRFDIILGKTAS
jgi:protocatechuate 3,4-dioxygenase beta subunit